MILAPSAIQIRRMNATDAEAFSALRRKLTQDNAVPMGLTLEEELARPIQGFRDQLSYPEPNAAFGAFIVGELVGSAAVAWPSKLASSRHKANLWGVFVAPSHRGLGIGRKLVSQAVGHALENGVRRINLQVFVPNTEAIKLYLTMGFVECGREPDAICLNGTYYDGVHMSLLRE